MKIAHIIMMRYFSIITVVLVLIFSSNSYAGVADGGGSLPVLNYGIGGRAAGMGNAYTAVAEGSSAIFWNPAGLVNSHQQEIEVMYQNLYKSITYLSAGYVYPIWKRGVIGLNIIFLSSGKIDRVTRQQRTIGSYNANQILISFSYAFKLSTFSKKSLSLKWFSLGVTAKLLLNTMSAAEQKVSGSPGLDAGFIINPIGKRFWENMTIGLKINNLVPTTSKLNGRQWYPMEFRLGIAYNIIFKSSKNLDYLSFSLDVSQYAKSNNIPGLYFGMEYFGFNVFRLRLGYVFFKRTISAGFGLEFDQFLFDYALNFNTNIGFSRFAGKGDRIDPEGFSNRISVAFRFGDIVP